MIFSKKFKREFWQEKKFFKGEQRPKLNPLMPLDLEIGCGNGRHPIAYAQRNKARQILAEKEVIANVKSLTNAEVLKDLKNYDFGFLLRDNTLLNNVSSPIKFQEYLMSGVIPIMSEGIGDYTEEMKEHNLAIITDKYNRVYKEDLLKLLRDKNLDDRLERYLNTYDFRSKVQEHPVIVLE